MTRKIWKGIGGIFIATIFATAMTAAPPSGYTNPNARQMAPAAPGTVNYVEGQATMNGQPIQQNEIGSMQLQAGQGVMTQNGRVEILLTPGVFVRVGSNSSLQMVSPDLANTVVRLDRGRALVEVDWIQKENRIQVLIGNVPVMLQEKGLYDFDADHSQIRVFDGRVAVMQGNEEHHVGGGHEMTLTAAKLKAEGFDKKAYEDDLYRWSRLRSSALAEANIEMGRTYSGAYGYASNPWVGPGWYWDPWFFGYTWLPGDGIFWNPWGFGFYSPIAVFGAPGIVGFRGGFHHFGPGFRPGVASIHAGMGTSHVTTSHVSGGMGSGFRGNAAGFHGGGGFHGGFRGGMGGGFHGGGGGHGGRR
ncbi:MAG TPA: hypothetical protein VKS01_12450 [Bryobacteraceae bacterium]|nr:hypothetical protein [Bryobacteraceae bacterium]